MPTDVPSDVMMPGEIISYRTEGNTIGLIERCIADRVKFNAPFELKVAMVRDGTHGPAFDISKIIVPSSRTLPYLLIGRFADPLNDEKSYVLLIDPYDHATGDSTIVAKLFGLGLLPELLIALR